MSKFSASSLAMDPLGGEIEGWPTDRRARAHNHHISLKERLKEYQNRIAQEKHPKAGGVHETTKAAAWAVFNHHGGGGGVGNSQPLGSAVRRPTRFKIEAQMKHEIAHRSSVSESIAASWDAGSTLFDSFELDALLKTLDEAANPVLPPEEAGAIVLYSQKYWLGRPQSSSPQQKPRISPTIRKPVDDGRLVTLDETRPLQTGADELEHRAVSYKLASNLTLDELYEQAQKEAEDDPFASFSHTPSPFNVRRNFRRSFDSSLQEKSGKGSSHNALNRSKWKNLLHTLHLDSASGLFHRFQGFHAQVAPHDSQKKLEQQRGRRPSRSVIVESKSDLADTERLKLSLQKPLIIEGAPFDPRFDPKNLHISKDVNPPPVKQAPQKDEKQRNSFWKSGLKAVFGRQASLVTENEEPLIPKAKKTDLQSVWQKKSDLQSAWSSFTSTMSNRGKDHEQGQRAKSLKPQRSSPVEPVIADHHYHIHHHHHHVSPEPSEDFELTVQAISKRVHRSSFEEKLARRFSLDDSPPARPAPITPSSAQHGQRVQRVHLTPWDAEKKGYGYSSKAGSYVH